MANPHADLAALTVHRRSVGTAATLQPPRRWVSRVLLPLVLLLGFAGVLAWTSWDTVFPPLGVRIVPVQLQTGIAEPTGQELFKANGWIEPRPLPIDVPVQTEGMYRVKEVLVNPGDAVQVGRLLVTLDDEKARLDVEAASKKHHRRVAAIDSAAADLGKARVALANAEVAIDLAKAEAEAEAKSVDADLAKARAMLASAELAVKVEEDLRQSGVVQSEVKLKQARQQRDVAEAEVTSIRAKVAKARTINESKIRQAQTARASAEADVHSLAARHEEVKHEAADAEVAVRLAQLELARTRLVAPCAGVVMQLNVRVGSVMGGKNTAIEHKDAAITLYDPAKLQVRVEVPINKFQFVQNGQRAIIEIDEVLPGQKLVGTVLYDTHLANIARNSVPVKVALPDNSPSSLRPEMIASVRFQATKPIKNSEGKPKERLLVPRRLVLWENDQPRVWIVDQLAGNAAVREIEVAPGARERSGATIEVLNGLEPTDKLIASQLDQLKPGLRVKVIGEDR